MLDSLTRGRWLSAAGGPPTAWRPRRRLRSRGRPGRAPRIRADYGGRTCVVDASRVLTRFGTGGRTAACGRRGRLAGTATDDLGRSSGGALVAGALRPPGPGSP